MTVRAIVESPVLLLKGVPARDAWTLLAPGDAVPDAGAVVVPLDTWIAERARLAVRAHPVGVWLAGDADPAPLVRDLPTLALVVVRFPKFADGRGMSLGRLLRERHGYRGELRAAGDFLPDQVWELSRCGFDAFVVDAGRAQAAAAALAAFSEAYQTSAAEPEPLFRRRIAERPAG